MTGQPCSIEWFEVTKLTTEPQESDGAAPDDEKLEKELRIRRRRIAEIYDRRICIDCDAQVEGEAERCTECNRRHDPPTSMPSAPPHVIR